MTRHAEAYYADDGRSNDNSHSAGHRSDSVSDGDYSRCSHDDDDDSCDGDENYAVAISSEETVPRKRAKHVSAPAKPAAPKKCITIAMSDDDDDWDDVSAKLGELAESFADFPPPGKVEKKHKHPRVAKKATRKKPIESVGPLDDLADTP